VAVSDKNAIGLCQIQPDTAKNAGYELAHKNMQFKYVNKNKLVNLSEDDFFDPAINILLACYLISKYNNKFDGKIELVLTAWNAGQYTDSLNYNEPASYPETLDLIGKVNGYFLYFLGHEKIVKQNIPNLRSIHR